MEGYMSETVQDRR